MSIMLISPEEGSKMFHQASLSYSGNGLLFPEMLI